MKRFLLFASFTIIALFISKMAFTNAGGAPIGTTGAPSETNCTSCHSGAGGGSGSASITFSGTNNQYIPGQTYQVTLTVNQADIIQFGFEGTCIRDNNNTFCGNITATDVTRTQTITGSRTWITHTSAGNVATSTGTSSWTFNWKAPSGNVGTATFYASFIAGDHSSTDGGDKWYSAKLKIFPGTGINEQRKKIALYSNPATGIIQLKFDNDVFHSINIYDINAKELKTISTSENQISFETNTFSPGIYFVRVEGNGEVGIEKFVVR